MSRSKLLDGPDNELPERLDGEKRLTPLPTELDGGDKVRVAPVHLAGREVGDEPLGLALVGPDMDFYTPGDVLKLPADGVTVEQLHLLEVQYEVIDTYSA